MDLGIEKDKQRMIGVLLVGTFITVLNAMLLTSALPAIMNDMGVSATTVQWLTSGYSLTEAVIIPLAAFLMGRFDTRKLFLGGMTIFAVGSIVSAVAPVFGLLLLGRVLQACATGFVMPMVFSVILLIIPRERRGSAMGAIGLIIGFAPTIGPSLSGVLVDTVGWRSIFAIVAVCAILVVIGALKAVKPYGDFKRSRFDVPSFLFSTIGLICLLYGLSSLSSSTNIALNIGLIVVGIALLALYARRQLTLDQPMLRVDILRTRNYRIAVICVAVFQATVMGVGTIMPLYIQGALGHTATVSGLALLPGAAISACAGLLSGRIFDSRGVRIPVLCGIVIIICGAAGFTLLGIDSSIIAVGVAYGLLVIGMQFVMTPLNTWGVNSLANEAIQHAQSTSNTINQVAASFGIALLVTVSSAVSGSTAAGSAAEQLFAGYHASFYVVVVLAVIAAILIIVLVRDKKMAKGTAGAGAAAAGAGAAQAGIGNAATAAEATGAGATAVTADILDAPQAEPAFAKAAKGALAGFELTDVMNANAATVPDTATMREVIGIIAATNTSGVSVVSKVGELVGYVTDGDAMRYLARTDVNMSMGTAGISLSVSDPESIEARLANLADLNVMELATKRVVSVEVDTPLDVACGVLAGKRIKKVPVTRDGKLVGALSRRNILRAMVNAID